MSTRQKQNWTSDQYLVTDRLLPDICERSDVLKGVVDHFGATKGYVLFFFAMSVLLLLVRLVMLVPGEPLWHGNCSHSQVMVVHTVGLLQRKVV